MSPPRRRPVAATATLVALMLGMATTLDAQPPKDWVLTGANPDQYEILVDRQVAHGGMASQLLAAMGAPDSDAWVASAQIVDAAAYRGKRVRLSGYVRTEEADAAGLWFRIDAELEGKMAMVGFDNMSDRFVRGTTKWRRYDLVLDVPDAGEALVFGALLLGQGKLWIDDLALDIVTAEVPLTGTAEPVTYDAPYTRSPGLLPRPSNLDFEAGADLGPVR